jgi:alpha-L-rhamnosidase
MKREIVWVGVGAALLAAREVAAEVTPAALRCEYRSQPLGIDVARPRLSWVIQSKRRGERQTAYQVLVASSREAVQAGRGDLWDSGKVTSSETAHVPYGGRALTSGQECWWSVRAWDRDGRASGYTAPERWSMGLLQPADWKAQWIGAEAPATAASVAQAATPPRSSGLEGLSWVWVAEGGSINPAEGAPAGRRYLRKRITLPESRMVQTARFLLTADDQFTLFINGREAGRSDGEADAWRRPRRLNVRQFLSPGTNLLAIAVENTSAGAAGVAGRLRIEFDSGDALLVPVDRSWKASRSAGEGWHTAAFEDQAWPGAVEIARVGEGVWGNLAAANAPRQLTLPPSPFLRREFRIQKPVRRATLYVTALGLYELRLDGRKVGVELFRPGWTDYRRRVYYQAYDVTSALRPGSHALGAILADGWACGYVGLGGRDRYGVGRPRLLAQLNLTYADGSSEKIATDGSWKAAYGPIQEADLLMGETYDARRELTGWDRSGFSDSSWQAVTTHAAWPARIEAYPGVPVRKMLELKPRAVTEPQPGVFVYDLGQNMVGWARLAARGPAGTSIRLRFAEVLNPDGTLYTTNLRGARCIDTYTLKGGAREVWEPRFTFHGFRYVEVTGYPGRPPLDAITGVVTYSDTPGTGAFTCSSEMVNQLQQNIVWGQRGNFLEVPTDCPQRDERLGWTGDIQAFVRTAANNMDVAAFLTKWMVDLEDAQRPDGAFTDVAPYVAAGAGTAAWGDAGVVVPWTLYQVYGDRRIIERHYDAMARWIDYLEKNSNGLLRPARGYGDWVAAGPPTPTDVIATAYFAYSTSLLAKMARAIGRDDDAANYDALFGRIRTAFNGAYVAADGRVKGNTQTAYLLALHMDLLPPELRPAALGHLVADIEGRGWHLATGFVGTEYLLPVLTRFGRSDAAYRLLLQESYPSWGYTVRNGATTIWERWDGIRPAADRRQASDQFQDPGMNSFNHYAFGCVGEWLFAAVAGIDTDPRQVGFQQIVVRPRPGNGLTWARASYDSIRGRIASSWKQEGDQLAVDVTLPANTTALIYLPASSADAVTEGGRPARSASGLRFVRMEDSAAVFEAGSGEYRFVVSGQG